MHNRRWVGRNRGITLKSNTKVTLVDALSTVMWNSYFTGCISTVNVRG